MRKLLIHRCGANDAEDETGLLEGKKRCKEMKRDIWWTAGNKPLDPGIAGLGKDLQGPF